MSLRYPRLCTILTSLTMTCVLGAQSSSSSSKHASKPATGLIDDGRVSNGTYHNPAFGFSCNIPSGWVLRTQEMNAPEDPVIGAGAEGRALLAAFSRPPEARGEDINASIVIAAESVATYPGLMDAAQYFGPLIEVVKARGFKVAEEPYGFAIGPKSLARADFQKDVGTHVMRQATLVYLARGYALSFTFIAGSEEDVDELIEGLKFGVVTK